MKFELILNKYEDELFIIKSSKERKVRSNEYLEGAYNSNRRWFSSLKYLCEDFPKFKPLSEEESKLYLNDKKEEASFKLEYRSNIIPIWIDDYGQQFYAIFNNHIVWTGSYPTFPEIIISDQIDNILDYNQTLN